MTKAIVRLSGCLLLLSLTFLSLSAKSSPEVSCGTTISTFPYSESFETGTGGWVNTGPINRWYRDSGGTPSGSTGPVTGYQDTYYMYIEASNSGTGYPYKEMNLQGPCFDLTGTQYATFEFAYHMWGYEMGSLALLISNDNGASWSNIWSKSGDQDNMWHLAQIDLTAYTGQTIQLRFKGITGELWGSDMAIDHVSLITSPTGTSTPLTCSATINSFPYQESFESGTGNWIANNTIWRRNSNSTTSSGTGPTSASNGSWYFYTEANSNYNKTSILTGPCFDLTSTSAASFSFDYHMNGAYMGSLALQVSADQGLSWSTIWAESGNIGSNWNQAAVNLNSYAGQNIVLRFLGVTGNSSTSDMAIDHLVLNNTSSPSNTGCTQVVSVFPYQESFESGQGLWTETTTSLDIWRTRSGTTSSGGTGPSSAYDGLSYIYTESSLPNNPNKVGILEGPCFDLSQAAAADLQFHYNMYGAYMGSLELQVSANNGSGWSTLWSQSGDQGVNWELAVVSLNDFLGQTIRLRFKTITGTGFQSDAAIDALVLSAPTSVNGSLAGTVLFPTTSSCGTGFQNCCDPNPSGMPVVNAPLTIHEMATGNVYPVLSDANGNFSANVPGGDLKITSTIPDNNWLNGLTGFDRFYLQQHINGTNIIDCPLRRIAADIDNDGDLDQTDLDLMNDIILNIKTSIPGAPNWKFIPIKYASDGSAHPDPRFVSDFWQDEATNGSGEDYPFVGMLRNQGQNYTYNGPESWQGTIHPTTFEPGAICAPTDWGFYLIKAGDVNGSASYTFSAGGANKQIGNNVLQIQPIRRNTSSELRNGNNKYEVRIVAAAEQPIIGYQMSVHFDDEIIELGKIKPNKEYLKQTEAKNFGQAIKTVRGGSFNTLWQADLTENREGLDFSSGVTLFAFEFKSKASLEEVQGSIGLDEALLETVFFDKEGAVSDVDLQIFVEPAKDK